MAKKVIGIILIVVSVLTIFVSGILLLTFGLLGGTFGIVGSAGGLSVEDGATVETVEGEVYYTDGSSTTIYYEVDGVPYIGDLNVYNSAYITVKNTGSLFILTAFPDNIIVVFCLHYLIAFTECKKNTFHFAFFIIWRIYNILKNLIKLNRA